MTRSAERLKRAWQKWNYALFDWRFKKISDEEFLRICEELQAAKLTDIMNQRAYGEAHG